MSRGPVKKYDYNGIDYTVGQLAKLAGVKPRVIYQRLSRGESVADALSPDPSKRLPPPKRVRPCKKKRYDVNGEQLTLDQISIRFGLPRKTLRTRIKAGKTVENGLLYTVDGPRVPTGDKPERAWRWRTEGLRKAALSRARLRSDVRLRSLWDAPMGFDPWSEAAIEAAERDGGWSLDLVGHIMDGMTRERIRQIEDVAFRKIRRAANAGRVDAVAFLSHWEDRREK